MPAVASTVDVSIAVERIFTQYCDGLTPLITALGARALLSRALRQASAEYPFLAAVHVSPQDGTCFDNFDEALVGVEAATVRDAFSTVLTDVAGLLAEFIGEELTMHMIREIWPAPFASEASQ